LLSSLHYSFAVDDAIFFVNFNTKNSTLKPNRHQKYFSTLKHLQCSMLKLVLHVIYFVKDGGYNYIIWVCSVPRAFKRRVSGGGRNRQRLPEVAARGRLFLGALFSHRADHRAFRARRR